MSQRAPHPSRLDRQSVNPTASIYSAIEQIYRCVVDTLIRGHAMAWYVVSLRMRQVYWYTPITLLAT